MIDPGTLAAIELAARIGTEAVSLAGKMFGLLKRLNDGEEITTEQIMEAKRKRDEAMQQLMDELNKTTSDENDSS